MAAACAEVGAFDVAVQWQNRAIEVYAAKRRSSGEGNLPEESGMRDRLSLYNRRLPYHEKPDRAGP
jgi:hypothetical protein